MPKLKLIFCLISSVLWIACESGGGSSSASRGLSTPVPGSAIVNSTLAVTTAIIDWGAASNDDGGTLYYKVMHSSSNNISTVTTAEANGILDLDWTADITHFDINGLPRNSTTYYVVLVKNSKGYKSIYPVNAITTGKVMYLVNAPTFSGAGPTALDAACAAAFPTGVTSAKAMISSSTRRACSTANCSGGISEHLDWVLTANSNYYAADESFMIGRTNSFGLFNFYLTNAIESVPTNVWTGLNANWTSGNTCSNWTSVSGAQNGDMGESDIINELSIHNSTNTCDTTGGSIYCVEQ